MSRNKRQFKNYSIGRHIQIPHSVLLSPQYKALSGNAVRLLNALTMQYSGGNNGDLTPAWSIMCSRGFNSKTTLKKCLDELLKSGLVVRTREGSFGSQRGEAALCAITWHRVDHCKGKHDYPVSDLPPVDWTKHKEDA